MRQPASGGKLWARSPRGYSLAFGTTYSRAQRPGSTVERMGTQDDVQPVVVREIRDWGRITLESPRRA